MSKMARAKRNNANLHLVLMSILSFVIGFFMSYDEAIMLNRIETSNSELKDVEDEDAISDSAKDEILSHKKYEAPSSTLELLGRIVIKQKYALEKMNKEYGRFTRDIFNTANLDDLFPLSPLSKSRLVRKLMVKILLARIRSSGGSHMGEASIRGEGKQEGDVPVFHWVTTGGSSAAGHGNAYSQSYTSILSDTVGDIFQSSGIKFVATNHAGHTMSGMELVFCMESMFGKEVDILSWDFPPQGTVDFYSPLTSSQGIDPFLFGERAGRSLPELPFLFFFRLSADSEQKQRLDKLEARGMGTGYLDETALHDLILTFPDGNRKSRTKLPWAIELLRCGRFIEGTKYCNDPIQHFKCISQDGQYCANKKFIGVKPSCMNDAYQNSWNDGRKLHLLKGRLLGFHMMEMLRLAAVALDRMEREDLQLLNNPNEMLDILIGEGEVEEFLFLKTQQARFDNLKESSFESWDDIKSKRSMCLTPPSINETPSTENSSSDSLPAVIFEPESVPLCEEFLPSQNSHYLISEFDGWVRIDPLQLHRSENKLDIARDDGNKNGVLFAICLKKCYGNQCLASESSVDIPVAWDKVEIRVNGIIVSGLKQLGGCYFLKSEFGFFWDDDVLSSSSDGVKILLHEGGGTLELSSSLLLY